MSADNEVVLELVQVVADQVLFGNDRTAPTSAVSMPREEWDGLGNPVTVTVMTVAGGDYVAPEKPLASPADALRDILQGGQTTPGAYL